MILVFRNFSANCTNILDTHQVSKSRLIVFEAQAKRLLAHFALDIEGCKITSTHSVKLPGVTLDCYLTFGEHIDNVVKKCHGLIGALAKQLSTLLRNYSDSFMFH